MAQLATFNVQVSPFTAGSAGNPAQGTVNLYDGNPTLASTTTTAAFSIPALFATAQAITVASTTGMVAGKYLYISDGTNSIVALISSVVSSTTVSIQTATITTGSAGNTMANGATVALTSLLDPANATNATFVVPAVNSSATINFAATTWITTGQYLNISDGTHTIIALVTSVGTGTVTIQTVSILAGSSGQTMAAGAAVLLSTNPVTGLAVFSTSTLAFGTHQIYAVFTDTDGNYLGGLANDNSISYTVQANTVINQLTATPSANGGDVYGQTVTLTAVVNSPTLGIPPTAGRVDFYDGASPPRARRIIWAARPFRRPPPRSARRPSPPMCSPSARTPSVRCTTMSCPIRIMAAARR